MKKKLLLIFASLIIVAVIYGVFNYVSKAILVRESNKTALKINQIKETTKVEDLGKYFVGIEGSFVLYDKNRNEYLIYNKEQAQKRVSPCSTFKILNSLIGLETKVLEDETTVFKWDGKKNYIDEWNKDHTLASAFKNSVVWYYQEVARRVGRERTQAYLKGVNYGNVNISGGLTKFWLDSSLRISPLEQVVFLRRFYSSDLPFSRTNIDIVKKIMTISNNNGVVLSGKTGFAGEHLGWFVGYVEKENNVYFFATKIEGKKVGITKAREITQNILKDKNLL